MILRRQSRIIAYAAIPFLQALSFNVFAETDCQERVEFRAPPQLPRTTKNLARIVDRNGGCSVAVSFELNEDGEPNVIASKSSSDGCDLFVKPAIKTVERSIFKVGKREVCDMKIHFRFGYR